MLGSLIKTARKKKGLSQVELAGLVNITQAALSKIEVGKVEPLRNTLIAIARALDDDFGIDWVRARMADSGPSPPSKKEMAEDMSVREFISLKFGGKETRRSRAELEMLTKLMDAEVERIKKEGW